MVSWGAGLPIVLDDEPSRSSGVPAGCCAKAGAATSVDSEMIRMDFFMREVLGGCLVDGCNVAVFFGNGRARGVQAFRCLPIRRTEKPHDQQACGCATLAPDGMDPAVYNRCRPASVQGAMKGWLRRVRMNSCVNLVHQMEA